MTARGRPGGTFTEPGRARHVPVLLSEVVASLRPVDGATYIDAEVSEAITRVPPTTEDVNADALAPIVKIRPCQLSFDRSIHGHQRVAGLFKRQGFPLGIPPRQRLLKQHIVEIPIEQGPVHIQEHIVDVVPVEDVSGTA